MIPFAKLQGAGNGYVAIDGRRLEIDFGRLARQMCAARFGVGSDGLLVALESRVASVRMRVFNPDGSEAEMSGNGIRLFAKFVLDRDLVAPGAEGLTVETLAGVRSIWPLIRAGRVVSARVSMGEPRFSPEAVPLDASFLSGATRAVDVPLELRGRSIAVSCLSIGNPHAVHFCAGPVSRFPLEEVGPQVVNHAIFPNRANFEIVNVVDRGHLRARVFERGAGETPSSGTGSTAAAVAARARGLTGDEVEVELPGGTLRVAWPGRGPATLEGPVVEVFTGVWTEAGGQP